MLILKGVDISCTWVSGRVDFILIFIDLLHRPGMGAEYCDQPICLRVCVSVCVRPLRDKVMKLGHDSIMSGHQGVKKSYSRVVSHFAWPGVHGDVRRYCQSCDICQRSSNHSGITQPIFTKFCVQIPCGHGSVLFWWRCATLCTSGFTDDVTFGHNGHNAEMWRPHCAATTMTGMQYWGGV